MSVTFSASQVRSLCGWIPPEQRTTAQQDAHNQIVGAMPQFRIMGAAEPIPDEIFLWEYAKKANSGKHFATLHQLLGSCVGEGACNAVWYLSAMEVHRLGDAEQVLLPWMGYIYGLSRKLGGLNGQGEGSFGSSAAEAVRRYGSIPANLDGLPSFQHSDSDIVWGRETELVWSDGSRIAQKWIDVGSKHLIKTTAQINSFEELLQALANGYPCTNASNIGFQMNPSVREGVLLNQYSDTWNHQTCFVGAKKHMTFGWLIYYLNSWSSKAHGVCPTGAPPGGFWITEKDAMRIVSQGETFAFSQFDGFPAQRLDHRLIG